MLTKERTSKNRKLKYAAVALALIAMLAFCFTSCGEGPLPTGVEYVSGLAKETYNPGETFDPTGAQIKVTYDDGTTAQVNVTAEMVGNVVLASGMQSVNVIFSANGTTLVTTIPVKVVDPDVQLKAEKIAALNANQLVVDNKLDGGVVLLLNDYTAKIEAAVGADAINVVVANFEAKLGEYLADKAEILAKFESDELMSNEKVLDDEGKDTGKYVGKILNLYAQFRTDIDSALATAKANVKSASTIADAQAYYDAFVVAVDNKLAEQEVYEGGENSNGQIFDKIDLLEYLDVYLAKVERLEDVVRNAYLAGEIEVGPRDEALADYAAIKKDLSWWEKYITLAIDLSNVSLELDTQIGEALLTGVDDAARLLRGEVNPAKDGVTAAVLGVEGGKVVVYPAKCDGTADVTGAFIAKVKEYLNEAKSKFGASGVQELKAAYGTYEVEGVVVVAMDNVLATIENKYATLSGYRTAVVNADLEALIKTAHDIAIPENDDGTVYNQKVAALDVAWKALKAWNDTTGVLSVEFTVDDDGHVVDPRVGFTQQFASIYDADVKEDNTWNSAATWTNDAFDLSYVKTYFIPNVADLITATQDKDAHLARDIEKAIPDLDEIVYSYDLSIDSAAKISAAQAELVSFKNKYGEEIYNQYFVVEGVDATQKSITEAQKRYDDLKVLAKAANDAIDAYETSLALTANALVDNDTVVAKVEVGHYTVDEGLLYPAYQAYRKFALENCGYTDVIDKYVAGMNDTTPVIEMSYNATNLLAFMKQYVEVLKYRAERELVVDNKISTAWVKKDLEYEGNIAFRNELQAYKNKKINDVATLAEYDFKHFEGQKLLLNEGEVNEDEVWITASNYMFYYDEILAENLEVVSKAIQQIADFITASKPGTDFGLN